jgi:large subunit ribosomal protein L6
MKMKSDIAYEITVPEEVKVEAAENVVTLTGPKGTVTKKMPSRKVSVAASGNIITIKASPATQREKKLANTYRAHMTHMIVGVLEGHTYKLRVCSGHFPMSTAMKGEILEVKNFLGETKPRTVKIKQGAQVKIEGDLITVEAPDKELAGQIAADIEQVTRITNRDRRIFQDGIYIIEKSKTRPIPQ